MSRNQLLGALCAAIVTGGGQYLTGHHSEVSVVIVTGIVAAASYLAGVLHGKNGG